MVRFDVTAVMECVSSCDSQYAKCWRILIQNIGGMVRINFFIKYSKSSWSIRNFKIIRSNCRHDMLIFIWLWAIMKRKFKQWWLIIPSTWAYGVGNQGPCFDHAWCVVKLVNDIPPLPLNRDEPACKCFDEIQF